MKATIMCEIDNPDDEILALDWIEENKNKLSYISDNYGCGCCVLMWDIEGDESVIATLPSHIACGSDWTRSS